MLVISWIYCGFYLCLLSPSNEDEQCDCTTAGNQEILQKETSPKFEMPATAQGQKLVAPTERLIPLLGSNLFWAGVPIGVAVTSLPPSCFCLFHSPQPNHQLIPESYGKD